MEKNSIIKAEGIEFAFNPDKKEEINRLDGLGLEVYDNLRVRLINDFITFEKSVTVPYTDAADSNYYPVFYTPNIRCFLIEARARHAANGGSGAAVTVEKLSNNQAKGTGTSMLSSVFTLIGGQTNIQRRGATTILAGVQLGPGDAIALRPSGTLTGLQ